MTRLRAKRRPSAGGTAPRVPVGRLLALAAATAAPLVLAAGCGWFGAEEEQPEGWWAGLDPDTKVFFGIAFVFSGSVAFVPARTAGGKALKAGTPVRVRRMLDASTVEVEEAKDQA